MSTKTRFEKEAKLAYICKAEGNLFCLDIIYISLNESDAPKPHIFPLPSKRFYFSLS